MDIMRSAVRRIGWVTTAVLVTFGLTPGVAGAAPADTGSNITPAERDEILAQHNLFRAEVGQPPLVWDATLAAGAQEWADAKQADGKFAHSGTNLGENLAGGEVKDATIRLATGVGVTPPDDERANYQSDPQPTGQEKKPVGHYTQIVWSSTTKVGCGFAPANKLAFGMVVCRYSPPGNFQGQFPYPPGTAIIPQPGLTPVQGAAGGPPPVEAPPVGAPPAEAPPAEEPPAGAPPAEAPPVGAPPGDTGGTPPDEAEAGEKPPADTPPAADTTAACPDAASSDLSPSAAEAALRCLITNARTGAGLSGLTASAPARTVAETIAQGTTPPDVPAALTAAGYCPDATITSWNYSTSGGGSPEAAFDSFAGKASDIVMSPGGDLGIGAAGNRFTLLLARCG